MNPHAAWLALNGWVPYKSANGRVVCHDGTRVIYLWETLEIRTLSKDWCACGWEEFSQGAALRAYLTAGGI